MASPNVPELLNQVVEKYRAEPGSTQVAADKKAADKLIEKVVELISALPAESPEAQTLNSAMLLIEKAIPIITSVPEAGMAAQLRWRVYKLIQAQKGSDNSALYKELRCSICLGLAGSDGADELAVGATVHPCTTPCGHSFCRGCITGMIGAGRRNCPICRVQIPAGYVPVDNAAIKGIVERLMPRPAAGGKRRGKKTRKNRR